MWTFWHSDHFQKLLSNFISSVLVPTWGISTFTVCMSFEHQPGFPAQMETTNPAIALLHLNPTKGDRVVTACSWLRLTPAVAPSPDHIPALEETFQIHQLNKHNTDPQEGKRSHRDQQHTPPLRSQPRYNMSSGGLPVPPAPEGPQGGPSVHPAACPTLLRAGDTGTQAGALGPCKVEQGLALVPHHSCIFSQLLFSEALVFHPSFHQV